MSKKELENALDGVQLLLQRLQKGYDEDILARIKNFVAENRSLLERIRALYQAMDGFGNETREALSVILT